MENLMLYRDYLHLTQDTDYTSLYKYYSQETTMGILGVARQENPHSSFLRWLLDVNSEHSLKSLPIRKFIETLCFAAEDLSNNGENNIFAENLPWLGDEKKKIVNILKFGRYEILNQFIANEVVLKKQRRADIFSVCELDIPEIKSKKYLVILIENKIASLENVDGDGQTVKYAEDMRNINNIFKTLKDKVNWLPKRVDNSQIIKIFVYLNAFPTNIIKNAYTKIKSGQNKSEISIAKSEEFITLNYQYLLDGMIEPLARMTSNDIARFRINDYIRCLSQAKIAPIQEQETKLSDLEYLIMAVSQYEKEKAVSLWEKHHNIILPILQSLRKSNAERFMLNDGDKSFWITLATLYGLIADECFSEDDAAELTALAKSIKYPFAIRYKFNGDEYQKRKGKKNIGRLCRDVIEDFVNCRKAQSSDIISTLKEFREEIQTWHPWLYEGILFKNEVEAIKKKEYKPQSKRYVEKIPVFRNVYFYDAPIKIDDNEIYVAKHWAIDIMQKLLHYLDETYQCHYTEKVSPVWNKNTEVNTDVRQ